MLRIPFFLILSAVVISSASGEILDPIPTPAVTVVFPNGRKAPAHIDHRTSDSKLWLRFGTRTAQIVRTFDWDDVKLLSSDEETLSVEAVKEFAEQAKKIMSAPPLEKPTDDEGPEPMTDLVPDQRQAAEPRPARTAAIRFDAELANWDADLESDGLFIRLQPIDAQGRLTAARGQANIQLWTLKRVGQDSQPRTRGRALERIAQHSVAVTIDPQADQDNWIRLPFDTRNPEFDRHLSSYGIVYVKLVVPGQGVFHHSMDGVRIRPFTPIRDVWHLHGRGTFFPVEPIVHR